MVGDHSSATPGPRKVVCRKGSGGGGRGLRTKVAAQGPPRGEGEYGTGNGSPRAARGGAPRRRKYTERNERCWQEPRTVANRARHCCPPSLQGACQPALPPGGLGLSCPSFGSLAPTRATNRSRSASMHPARWFGRASQVAPGARLTPGVQRSPTLNQRNVGSMGIDCHGWRGLKVAVAFALPTRLAARTGRTSVILPRHRAPRPCVAHDPAPLPCAAICRQRDN